MFYIFCTDWLTGYIGHRPIPDGTKVVKPNRYTADQSPLLMEEPTGFFTLYSETLPRSSLREQPQPGSADGFTGLL